jgi:2-oxoglutarate ferredoxin oxidoreductase subunit gamma
MKNNKHLYTNLTMAGFGGQGLMFIGKLLAFSSMKAGLNVTWIPSYGPEMRGGTANCTVVISDEPIASPVIKKPESLIIMNNPSLEAFEPKMKAGGTLFINSNLVTRPIERKDIKVVSVPADDIAVAVGEKKSANMVMLGAYLGRMEIVDSEQIAEGCKELFGAKAGQLMEVNMKAFNEGMKHAKAVAV